MNDTCVNCGRCCTPCLQMTQEEIDIIKQYIIDNNIQELIYRKDGRLEYVCPFRDEVNEKCTIYEVRPRVCSLYKCWEPLGGLEDHIEELVNTAVNTCGVHELFFNNVWFLEQYKLDNEEE